MFFICAQTEAESPNTRHEYMTRTINRPKKKKETTDKWKEQMVRQTANSKEVSEHNNVVKRTE
jgi:hypothetical protein